MAIGWLTVLQNVPWTDLLRNAPQIADGAKKLWKSTSRDSSGAPSAADSRTAGEPTLAAQVRSLEARVADLHQQMVESSALIQSLADQHAQLIARIDADRRRARRWMVALTLLSAMLGAAIALWLTPHGH